MRYYRTRKNKQKEEAQKLLNNINSNDSNNISKESVNQVKINNLFRGVVNKLNHICMTCDFNYNEDAYKNKDRMQCVEGHLLELMNLYEKEDNNFLRKSEVAKNIGFDENVRKTFMGGMNHLVRIYNEEGLSGERKLKQMYTTSLFLAGLLNRNFEE